MRAPDWLTARPVAHRGLHDIARGIVENMPAAAQAAIDGNFAIECDIQLSSDGEAMVHHDNALGRLTEGSGALLGKTAAELKAIKFRNTDERRLVKRMAEVLASYSGPAVGMSFDPDQVVALRELIPGRARGIVAEHEYTAEEWPEASAEQRRGMTHLRHAFRTRPHFVAYWVDELPAAAPWIARNVFGLPLLSWTVRTPEQRTRAISNADQMIFEGFLPGT